MASKLDKYGRESDQPTTDELVRELIADSQADSKPFIPSGYCPKHYVKISNGMFDAPCPLCESEMEEEAHRLPV